jgi:Fe-S-cluster containining protein
MRGLPLTEKEADLFPKEAVSPKVATGTDKPENVILFQLNLGCCPNINDKNECTIYVNRPLMCQSFPIVAGAISNRCRVFNYRKTGLNYEEPYSMSTQIKASDRLEKYVQKKLTKGSRSKQKIWEYDLKTKRWFLQA